MATADEIRLALTLYGSSQTVLRNLEPTSVNRAVDGLLGAGLLDEVKPGEYEGNEALTMWVEALALVPFPVQRWTIPRFRLPAWNED